MIDILLVNPREHHGFFEKMPPLGLASLAAVLESGSTSVAIADLEIEHGSLEDWLRRVQPRFLGISGTTHTRFESYDIARRAKRHNPEIVTIYGGVHASFTGRETLATVPEIDYVIRGEAERSLPALIAAHQSGANLQLIPGLAYRGDGGISENKRPLRMDLESLPQPAYHFLNMKKYSLKMEFVKKRGISLLTSRGCLARCSFCSASRMFDHLVTTRTAATTVDMIEFLFKEYGYSGIKVFDSTFTIDRDHVAAVCDEIIRRGLRFPWECEVRIGTVDRPLLETMKNAGCYYVDIGVESGSQKVLNLMRKGITVEEAEETIRICHETGLKIKAFFSIGHIGENLDDVEKTFAFIEKLRPMISTIACGAGVRIYPGTYLENYCLTNKLLPPDFSWTAPYEDEWLANIFQTTTVPVLLQPQLGKRELENIALRIYKQRFQGWAGFKKGLKKLADPAKIRKIPTILKLQIRDRFEPRKKP